MALQFEGFRLRQAKTMHPLKNLRSGDGKYVVAVTARVVSV